MITISEPVPTTLDEARPQAALVVNHGNLDVRYASPRAVEWLALPADRLLGRSLLLSVPALGQALSLALAGGLGPEPVALHAPLATSEGMQVWAYAQQRDADILIELRPATSTAGGREATNGTTAGATVPDAVGALRRLDEMRQDLAALRTRVPCDEAMLRGDDPILFWLWQAEAALAQVRERYPALMAAMRRPTGSWRRTP
jgi:hypothetical protein